MKTPFEDQEFCQETFGEALPEGFREGAIAGMARTAKRKRLARRVGGIVMMGLMAGLLTMALFKKPAPAEGIILARSVEPNWIIRSSELPKEMIIRSAPVRMEMVRSVEGANYEVISDEQLLALARDRHIGLVRMLGKVEAVFLEEGLETNE